MEEANLSEDKQNSITLKKDSKGNYNWDIKVYFNDDDAKALKTINSLDTELRNIYNN